MIIDKILEKILNKKREILMKENRDVSLVIYIGEDDWRKAMAELRGQLSYLAYDMHKNNGERIAGFPVFRVIGRSHGIKVFEV